MPKHDSINHHLLAIKFYLETKSYLPGLSSNEKRNVRKRSLDFKLENGEMYFVQTIFCDTDDTASNTTSTTTTGTIEYERLRKVMFTDSERNKVISGLHVDNTGVHNGVDKTCKAVQMSYYWVGMTDTVKAFIKNCSDCVSSRLEQKKSNYFINQINKPEVITATAIITTKQETPLRLQVISETEQDSKANDSNINGVEEILLLEVKDEPTGYVTEEPDIIPRFWHTVEIDVLGPFEMNNKSVYVCIAVDVFSKWIEVKILDEVCNKSLSKFILQLVCRYGIMECLYIKNSRFNTTIDITNNSLSSSIVCNTVSHAETLWNRLTTELNRFITDYNTDWFECLELFLLPFRISCSDKTDYSPAYLVFGREPYLNNIINTNNEENTEIVMSDNELSKCIDKLMCINKNINLSASNTSTNSQTVNSDNIVDQQSPSTSTTVTDLDSKDQDFIQGQDKDNDKDKNDDKLKDDDDDDDDKTEDNGGNNDRDNDVEVDNDDVVDDDNDDDYQPLSESANSPVTRRRSLRRVKQDWSCLVGKRKRTSDKIVDEKSSPIKHRKVNSPNKERKVTSPVKPSPVKLRKMSNIGLLKEKSVKSTPEKRSNVDYNKLNDLSSLETDEFYDTVKHLLELQLTKSDFSLKPNISKSLVSFSIDDDNLYYQPTPKHRKKQIIMSDKERVRLMAKAHIDDEGTHLCKRKVIDCISAMDNYWRGLTLDCEAFVIACPECNKGDIRKPNKDDDIETDDQLQKDVDADEINSEVIKQYVIHKTYPKHYNKKNKTTLRRKSQNYFLEDDVLYYRFSSRPDSEPKKCLFTKQQKIEAIKDAHIVAETSVHLGLNKTQEQIKNKYYWVGQTHDVYVYINQCCSTSDKPLEEQYNKKTAIDLRIEKFKHYFNEGVLDEFIKKSSPIKDLSTDNSTVDSPDNLSTKDTTTRIDNISDNITSTNSAVIQISGSSPTNKSTPSVTCKDASTSTPIVYDLNPADDSNEDITMSSIDVLASQEENVSKCAVTKIPTATEMDSNISTESAKYGHGVKISDSVKISDGVKTSDGVNISDSVKTSDSVKISDGINISDVKTYDDVKISDGVKNYNGVKISDGFKNAEVQFYNGVKVVDSVNISDGVKILRCVKISDGIKISNDNAVLNSGDNPVPNDDNVASDVDAKCSDHVNIPENSIVPDSIKLVTESIVKTEEVQTYGNDKSVGTDSDDAMLVEYVPVKTEALPTDTIPAVNIDTYLLNNSEDNKHNIKKSVKQGWSQCRMCQAVFSGKVAYRLHMLKHDGIKPYSCDFCKKGFTSLKAKVLHHRSHTGEKPYLCNICGRGFERKGGLRYHLKAHEKGGGTPVKCDICSRSFQSASRLDLHKSCKHPDQPPIFICEYCNKTFSFKRSLKRHIASTHLLEKKFRCDLCNRAFARNEYLLKHVQNQHCRSSGTQIKLESGTDPSFVQYIDAVTMAQLTEHGEVTIHNDVILNENEIQEVSNSTSTIVFTQDSVQYEVECLTTDQSLSVDDQQAIQLLVQASLQSQQYADSQPKKDLSEQVE